MAQNVTGTFVSAQSVNNGQLSDILVVPAGITGGTRVGLVNISGDISASNPVTLQRTLNNGASWSTFGGPYTSAQTNTQVTLSPVGQYRYLCDMGQAGKTINYSLSAES